MGYDIKGGNYDKTSKQVEVKSFKGLRIILGIGIGGIFCCLLVLGIVCCVLLRLPKSQLVLIDSYSLITSGNNDNTVSFIESVDRFGKVTKLNSDYYLSIDGKTRRVDKIIGHSNYDSFVSSMNTTEWKLYRKIK